MTRCALASFTRVWRTVGASGESLSSRAVPNRAGMPSKAARRRTDAVREQGQVPGRVKFRAPDLFQNRGELQDDLSNAKKSQTAAEQGVNDVEWDFVIGTSGNVSHKFEGYATFEELKEALWEVL